MTMGMHAAYAQLLSRHSLTLHSAPYPFLPVVGWLPSSVVKSKEGFTSIFQLCWSLRRIVTPSSCRTVQMSTMTLCVRSRTVLVRGAASQCGFESRRGSSGEQFHESTVIIVHTSELEGPTYHLGFLS